MPAAVHGLQRRGCGASCRHRNFRTQDNKLYAKCAGESDGGPDVESDGGPDVESDGGLYVESDGGPDVESDGGLYVESDGGLYVDPDDSPYCGLMQNNQSGCRLGERNSDVGSGIRPG